MAIRVLFVCTGNTCRSVFAEYLGRRFIKDAAFESAGIRPQRGADAENAVFTLKRQFGIDAAKHVPRDVRTTDLLAFDLIVAFGQDVADVVTGLGAPSSRLRVWEVQDPWGPNLTEYDRAALEIRTKLAQLSAPSRDA